jgi:hypothetical protein
VIKYENVEQKMHPIVSFLVKTKPHDEYFSQQHSNFEPKKGKKVTNTRNKKI